LNLPAGKLRLALQRLIAVGTMKFKFAGVHSLHLLHAQTRREKYGKDLFILLVARIRM
jgi:hypothetical protein